MNPKYIIAGLFTGLFFGAYADGWLVGACAGAAIGLLLGCVAQLERRIQRLESSVDTPRRDGLSDQDRPTEPKKPEMIKPEPASSSWYAFASIDSEPLPRSSK